MIRCPNCGFQNPPRFNFCGQCGKSLKAEGRNQTDEPLHPSSFILHPSSERRHLTVMFCDLVGSSTLAEQLDPEEWREVLRAYQQLCTGVIQRYEGYIAQHLGDGLLVYFGYPVAHEDDARRAIRAGLGIVAQLKQNTPLLRQTLGVQLAVRVGIHTGLVVMDEVGYGERREQLALGETTNLAARIQALTAPSTVALSAVTWRLAQHAFIYRKLGPHNLKGFSHPIEIYRALREKTRSHRFKPALSTKLPPLVGRESELAFLEARWEGVKQNQAQVVLLSGEAGIGKSRLVQAFRERVAAQPHLWLEGQGSPYHQQSAFYPLLELLQRLFRFKSRDNQAEKLAKLERALHGANLPTEALPLLAALLSLPLPEAAHPVGLSPQAQKQKTLETLLTGLLALAARRSVIVVDEDLHWVDPSTLELLTFLIERLDAARVLLLLTFRPDFSPPWTAQAHVAALQLGRLDVQHTQAMIQQVAKRKLLPPELLQQLIAKTDGIPLYVEELTKMVLEQGLLTEQAGHYELANPLFSLDIPATLQDSLMARLDRLATVREVAQLSATLGREFSYELLQAITPLPEVALQHDLRRLVEAELLQQQGLPPRAIYHFKHALIQETAYNSLLRRKRQQYHQQIAQVLEQRFPDLVATQPELLAHHFTAAGLPRQAIRYWQAAGERALTRSANLEAIAHFRQGLAALSRLPQTPERTGQELTLQISLGVPLLMTKGYASLEVEQTYGRARELCRGLGDTPQLFSALFGLWVFHLVRAELPLALELAQELMKTAQRLSQVSFRLEAHQALGVTQFYRGELETAQTHLDEVITQYDPQQHQLHASFGGADLGVTCLCHAALALWLRGYPAQAVQRSEQAIALAYKSPHPFSLAFALCLTGWLHQYRGEKSRAQERAAAAMALSHEQGFALSAAFGAVLHGWAVMETDVTSLQQGLAAYGATGAELGRLQFLTLLAAGYLHLGQAAAGLAVLDKALAAVPRSEERFFEAELYRLRGEGVLRKDEGGGRKAEECFLQAIEVARRQGAKSLELRATLSLARLWRSAGSPDKLAEAHNLLSSSYGWFTEGFETADLQEAKVMLAEMARLLH
ncbi:MAG: adenylate/guanylate cyclase domain-containing protein [Anaerolineae bacterium]